MLMGRSTLLRYYVYLGDLLNIDNSYFEHMVREKFPTEVQLNKANGFDTVSTVLNMDLSKW